MTRALPRAVLFDLDGTLTESLPGIAWSLNEGRRDLGLPPVPDSDVRRWLGAGAAILAARSLGLEDVHDPRVVELTTVYLRHNEEGAAAHTRLYPGARELLADLRRRGVLVALTTNKPRANTDALLAHLSLHHLFDAVVTPESAGVLKPDGRFFRAALDVLGVAAADALVVGDGEQDVLAAKAAGVRVVAILGGYGDPAVLRAAGADEYVETLAEFAARFN